MSSSHVGSPPLKSATPLLSSVTARNFFSAIDEYKGRRRMTRGEERGVRHHVSGERYIGSNQETAKGVEQTSITS